MYSNANLLDYMVDLTSIKHISVVECYRHCTFMLWILIHSRTRRTIGVFTLDNSFLWRKGEAGERKKSDELWSGGCVRACVCASVLIYVVKNTITEIINSVEAQYHCLS